LRQHIRPTERIHGIITKGGDKANIVPAETAMEWIVRSATIESLQPLKQRVLTSLESAASACACTVDHEWHGHTYADMVNNGPMVAAYVSNAARIGRNVVDPAVNGRRVVGSTDMGNVSYLVPSIHPMIKVAADGVAIHTLEFAEWARSPDGDKAVLDGAKAMAMTIIDLWTSAQLRDDVTAAFADRSLSVDVL
jgi:metal-dependent amidase/aminoacylase/carboxypeptidase family protein